MAHEVEVCVCVCVRIGTCDAMFLLFGLQVNVLFFAKSKELTGVAAATIKLPPILNGAELLTHLFSSYPRFRLT